MSRIRYIVLPNPAPIMNTFVVVHYRDNESGWEITNVELYGDAELTVLHNDDIRIAEQSQAFQDKVYAALNNRTDPVKCERGMRRLWADIQADAAASRVVDLDAAAARAWN
jgi:hypothetical protein